MELHKQKGCAREFVLGSGLFLFVWYALSVFLIRSCHGSVDMNLCPQTLKLLALAVAPHGYALNPLKTSPEYTWAGPMGNVCCSKIKLSATG